MSVHNHPRQYREVLTNAQLLDRLQRDLEFHRIWFSEPIDLSNLPLGGQKFVDCVFDQGFILRDNKFTDDVSFEHSILSGHCLIEKRSLNRVIDLTHIDASSATMHFNISDVIKHEIADLWLSFKEDTVIPHVDTSNAIIRQMFNRRPVGTAFVSYQELLAEST